MNTATGLGVDVETIAGEVEPRHFSVLGDPRRSDDHS
jgi:hypothetical protein